MFRRKEASRPALSHEEIHAARAAAIRGAEAEARAQLAALPLARSFESCSKCGGTDLTRKLERRHVLATARVEYAGPDGKLWGGEPLPVISEVLHVRCPCGGLREIERTADCDPDTAALRYEVPPW